jgi:hypothetical protein
MVRFDWTWCDFAQPLLSCTTSSGVEQAFAILPPDGLLHRLAVEVFFHERSNPQTPLPKPSRLLAGALMWLASLGAASEMSPSARGATPVEEVAPYFEVGFPLQFSRVSEVSKPAESSPRFPPVIYPG